MRAPTCPTEAERIAALERYDILDTPREPAYDALVKLVARVCDVPFAVVNLIAADRQWFKAEQGFGVRETPLDSSFCAHAILEDELMVIPDAQDDSRFQNNPLVLGDPRLRFYAGSLLKTRDGHALGTLCVLDTEPRQLSDEQVEALGVLADQVMQLLELHRHVRERDRLVTRLDAALTAREQILSIVSHDLRTPLGTVMMTAEALRELATDDDTRRAGERLERAAGAMRRLVDDLLDFESLDTGRLSLERAPTAAADILGDVRAVFEDAARSKNVELTLEDASGASLMCDRGRVAQALGNLVSNAIRHTPEGGRVSVVVHPAADARVAIRVVDSGPGFPVELGDRMFEPFVRGPARQARGTGLGLAIAKRIVDRHGGHLAASTAPGVGAIFELALPA